MLSKYIKQTILLVSLSLSVVYANTNLAFPVAPNVWAKAYMLVDLSSNQILLESDNVNEPIEPASLTKLMSGYLVFEALKNNQISLEQKFSVSERAWRMGGSKMFIHPQMRVSVDDLLKGMIVQSGNDATVALAEGVGGSYQDFVQMMNQKAQQLGLTNTNYMNPEGLTENGHYTSVRDLTILSAQLIYDFPHYLNYSSIKEYHYPGTPESNRFNRNLLLYRDPSVDGLKTGHTDAAGYCLVATSLREQNGVQRRLLSIVVGTENATARAQESQKLLDWGYTVYKAVPILSANQVVQTAKVWKGFDNLVTLGVAEDLVISLPSEQAKKVSTKVVISSKIVAPVKLYQPVAKLHIMLEDQLLREVDLVALKEVKRAGFLIGLWHGFLMWFN